MPDVAIIQDPATALAALDPRRARLLAALAAEPGSAASVAARVGLPRQQVGHHLRALENHGLLVEIARRRHGGLVERVLGTSAASYVVSPAALGPAGAEPGLVRDRLSAGYLVALAARAMREVGTLLAGAQAAGRRVPTLSVDTDVRFATAADRAAFASELAESVRTLAARHHAASAPGGRWYRVVVMSHPRPGEGAPDRD